MMKRPDFMKTPEWEKYGLAGFKLKEGAPEWLKKALADWKKKKEDAKARGIWL